MWLRLQQRYTSYLSQFQLHSNSSIYLCSFTSSQNLIIIDYCDYQQYKLKMQDRQYNSEQDDYIYMQNLYVVDAIMKKKKTSEGYKYLIRWKDYPDQKDFTWQPLSNLLSVQYMVDQFQKQLQEKKRKYEENIAYKKNTNNQTSQIQQSNKQKESATNSNINKQKQTINNCNLKDGNKDEQALRHINIKDKDRQMKNKGFKDNQDSNIMPKDKFKTTSTTTNYKIDKQLLNISSKGKQTALQTMVKDKYVYNDNKTYQNSTKIKSKQKQLDQNIDRNTKELLIQDSDKLWQKDLHFSNKEKPQKLQKSKQSSTDAYVNPFSIHKYGKICNHLYHNGQLFYQTQIINTQTNKIINIQMISSSKLKKTCQSFINDYLEKLLIELEQSYKRS